MIGYTTIQQSKKLIELGLNPETSDMSYVKCADAEQEWYQAENRKQILAYDKKHWIPCWSLNALLEVMPGSISKYDSSARATKSYGLNLFRSHYHCCGYSFGPSLNKENHDSLCCFGAKTWVDAVFKCLVWLLENGYDKGGDTEYGR